LRNLSTTEPISIFTDYDGSAYGWEFNADGSLTTPGDITVAGDITGTSGANTLILKAQPTSNTAIQLNSTVDSTISTVANLEISTDASNTAQTWQFDVNGTLTLPEGAQIRNTAGNAVAFGLNAGQTSQGDRAVAIGLEAGTTSQGVGGVAIGEQAGHISQGVLSVAIGYYAGSNAQSFSAVAIGAQAGETAQGSGAIAIGDLAGRTNQASNSIIINATGANLDQTTANTFTVAPVRNDVANTGEVVFYNTTSKEITYGNTISVAGNISAQAVITNSISSDDSTILVIEDGLDVKGDIDATGNITAGNVEVTEQNDKFITAFGTLGYNSDRGAWGLESTGGFGSVDLTSATIDNETGNVTAQYTVSVVNDGRLVLPESSEANVAKLTSPPNNANVSLQLYSGNAVRIVSNSAGEPFVWTFGTTGAFTAPGNISAVGNITGENLITSGVIDLGSNASIYTNSGGANNLYIDDDNEVWLSINDGTNSVTLDATGNLKVVIQEASGNSVNVNFSVLGNGVTQTNTSIETTGNITTTGNVTATNLPTKFSGSWSVPTGNSTQSFTVDSNNTYQMWVEGNIPNGIIAWNALVTVTNNNVPVLGQQFAWNYEGGGNVLMFNSIPDQIIGTAGAISNVEPEVSNTNVFSFGINNASGNTVTVEYGWVKLS
jgi:hypothetical protein